MRDYTRNQMDHFRQQLQLLILGKGLTRKELSRKLNRNQNTIQQWITKDDIKPAHVQERIIDSLIKGNTSVQLH